jgi:hypothetical protein
MKRGLWLLLALWPMVGLTDEAGLTELLGRIRHTGSAEFSYQETRKLELASSPWNGQGLMLSGADGSLIKLQLQPMRIIMVSTEQRMYYWDPEQKQRHSAPVGQTGAAGKQITLFRSIIQGHIEGLRSDYDFIPGKHGKLWILRMTPKPELSDEDAPTIEISSDEDDGIRRVQIRQADGEFTEYRMVKTAEGQEVDKSIQRLMLETIGE